MTLYDAIKGKHLPPLPWRDLQLHVRTSDGKLGTVEKVERNETRGYLMVTLRHFNGEAFPHEYVASACTVLERRCGHGLEYSSTSPEHVVYGMCQGPLEAK